MYNIQAEKGSAGGVYSSQTQTLISADEEKNRQAEAPLNLLLFPFCCWY